MKQLFLVVSLVVIYLSNAQVKIGGVDPSNENSSSLLELKSTNQGFLPSIVIGTQQWTSENLNVLTYRNGDVIPQVTDAKAWATLKTGAWCYYNIDELNGPIYGKLYNWYAVHDPRGLAPKGWHIPTDAEWTTLTDNLGGETIAGGKMKTTENTTSSNGKWATPNTRATNESGFSGLPGGYRDFNGTFYYIGFYGYWWSSSEFSKPSALFRILYYYLDNAATSDYHKIAGFSVRCIKD